MKKQHHVCVLGGSGFVGTHLVAKLSDEGYQVTVLSRRPERQRHLLVLPTVQVVEANVGDEEGLAEHFSGMDTVVNLIGLLHESGKNNFANLHVALARKVAAACRVAGVRRLLHMSALNADEARGVSNYLRSKGEAEGHAHALHDVAVTSFRPSVIFGDDDSFFNRFATLLDLSPGFLPLAAPNVRFAPVFVGDVVSAMVSSIDMEETYGQRYNLCGPNAYSLRELVEFTAQVIGSKCKIIGLSDSLSEIMARIMELVPGKPLTRDNLASMKADSVCDGAFPAVFNVEPVSIEAIVPTYLLQGREGEYFDRLREVARHE
ncbi:MAG: complex I NDUFA9 subunit family protein [Gammaproteobacteria bacterium]|nr:complex I NDUFA9 subunit family protein [Gammaproteobacteria bacterium]